MPTNNVTASNLTASTASLGVPSFSPPVILSDYVLDFGMLTFHNNCDRIYVCTGPVTDFASVIATSVGYKVFGTGNAFGGINNGNPSGRIATSVSFTDGSIIANGLAICWAAVDFANSNLLAWGVLAGDVSVIAGQLFGLPSFIIHEQSYFSGSGVIVQCQPASSLATRASALTSSALISPLLSATVLAAQAAGLAVPIMRVGYALTAFPFQPTHTDALGTPALAGGGAYTLTSATLAAARPAFGTPVFGIVGTTQYADGFTAAPVVSTGPQFPRLLDMYRVTHGIVWPWKVAGVDYPVGCATNITLNDPTIQANLPTGATANASTKTINVTGNNVTLNGYQFPNDWYINITTATGTCTITNCRIKGTLGSTYNQIYSSASCAIVIKYCEFDQSKVSSSTNADFASSVNLTGNPASITVQYCWFHGIMIDAMGFGLGTIPTIDCRYNVISGIGYAGPSATGGGHPDALQLIELNSTSITWAFNTQFSPVDTYQQGGPAIMFESQSGGSFSGGLIGNNTIVLGTGGFANFDIITGVFLETGGVAIDNVSTVWNMMDINSTVLSDCYTPSSGPTNRFYNHNFDMGSGAAVDTEPPVAYGTFITTQDIYSATTAAPSSGTITTGQSVVFTLHYNRAVNIVGTPQLTLNNGAFANYSSGSGTRNLAFTYTVQSTDTAKTGLAVSSLGLNGGTVRDILGNNMFLTGVAATFASLNVSTTVVSNVPVISATSFTLADPVTNDELVGTINATNTPTSWAITGGNTSNYFAIFVQTDGSSHLRTSASGAVAIDGTYSLIVTASNASGTSSPATIPVQVGSGVGSAPAVTAASFTLFDPVTNAETVGTVSATNAPTSFAITAGNSGGYFTISTAGVIKTLASGTVPPDATYTLSVTATNANGTSAPATITIIVRQVAVPIVNDSSFTLTDPVTNSEVVGTETASNNPTSFAITAGNSTGYFTISSAGVISVRSSGTVPPDATYSLSITASNAGGTSAVATATITVQQAGSGGGAYNNLNHWPSTNNRPVYNSSNNSITWIGPVGGGASTVSDLQQTQTLTNSGSITTSAAGQVIQNLHITGSGAECITVNHNNVTIKRCYVQGHGGSDTYNIAVTPGVTGTLIEDCEVDGKGNSAESGSFNILAPGGILSSCTVRRNHLHGCEQMVARTMQNVTIIDNHMHDVTGVDADMIEIYVDSGNSHDVLIQHNTFQEPLVNPSLNSAINMSNWVAPNVISKINITGNRFMCSDSPHVLCDDNRQGTGSLTYSFTNNGLASNIVFVQTGDNNGVSPNSGNFVLTDTADTSITGALFKGTGVI